MIDLSQWDSYRSIDEYADPTYQWVDNGAVVTRASNPATLNGTLISGIPCYGNLYIDGIVYPVTDSEVQLDLPLGVRLVRLECFPYLPIQFEVTT